jgi:hypothetical protein
LSHKFTFSTAGKFTNSGEDLPVRPAEGLINFTVCVGESFEHVY